MKIAYVTSHFPDGPGERFFEPEVQTLAQLGAEILIVPARPRHAGSTGENLPVLRLSVFNLRTLALAAAETLTNGPRVRQALRATISAKYRFATKCKNLALFPKALAVGRSLRAEGIDHIHAQWLSTPSTVAYVASIITGIPWSCTAHRFDIFQDNLLAQKAASARFIRTISSRNREYILQRAPLAAARCRVVHLGVMVPARTSGPRNDGVPRILCAANLVPVKGHDFLIRALAILRDRGIPVECDLAGEGPLRSAILAQIARERLQSRVRLRGYVEHERLCAELVGGKYDAFVLASTEDSDEFEGIPVALMEAMAAGVPCIATRTGSIAELIEDGVTSSLVEQRDAPALADAIARFVSDPHMRTDVGRRARERVQQQFDTQQTTRELFDLIRASSPVSA